MLDNKLLVFPTNRAIRDFILKLSSKNAILPKTITIGDFLQTSIFVPNKKLISLELKTIFLQKVVQNIDIKKLGLSITFSSFLKQSEFIIRFFNELAYEFKNIEDIEHSDTYAHYSDHLKILKNIQIVYHNLLQENNYYDQSLLPKFYKINDNYIKQFDKITIYYEGYFSSFEFEIINKISKLVEVEIICTIDDFNTKNIQIFDTIGIKLESNYKYILNISKKQILKKTKLKQKEYNLKITPIPLKILQVAFIKQEIYTLITIKKINPSKIVVVLPDESFAKTLKLFDDEKYFNFAMGNDIAQSKIAITIDTINKLLVNYEPKDNDKLEVFKIDKELFENLIKKNWNKVISKELFLEIYEKLTICETNIFIIDKLNELKISLTILFFSHQLHLRLKEIFKILQDKISTITTDDTQGGKITVLGVLETRMIRYDGVIVVDFNDNLVPKRSLKDKFLSTKIKKIAQLPTTIDRQNLQKYYYKSLFDKAKYISICYVDDENLIKSRFLTQIFPNTKEIIDNNIYDNILYKTKYLKHFEKQIIKDINMSKQIWSATSLKIFLQCKRQYYFKYILKIKEHNTDIKPQAFELGQIVHKVIENLTNTNTLTQENLNDQLSSYQNLNPYLTIQLEIWKKKLEKFIKNEQQRKSNGYQIYKTEEPFLFKYKNVMIKGIIDRIDKINNFYEILDYKTSSSLKIDTIKTYQDSYDFQLEFYALALRDKNISNVAYYDLNTATIYKQTMLNEKIQLLEKKLQSLDTKKVDFFLCEDTKICLYCSYKTMCQRD